MGTKQQTTNQYSQSGMNAYNAFQPQLQSVLGGYASNPFGNPFYQLNLSSNMATANRQSGQMNQNALSQFNMTGMGGAPSGARTSLMAQLGRYGSSLNAGAFQSAASNAFTNQMGALNTMAGYRPLQTGQTQQTTGLGTWLPQLVGAAAGIGMGVATGGASLAAGAASNAGQQISGYGAQDTGNAFSQGGFSGAAGSSAGPQPPGMMPSGMTF
jgi:hypothetical protein